MYGVLLTETERHELHTKRRIREKHERYNENIEKKYMRQQKCGLSESKRHSGTQLLGFMSPDGF